MQLTKLHMKKILHILLPLLVAAAGEIFCSAESYFRHITVEDGLSSNYVRSLMQDSYGFVWIGTDHGVNRFDGSSFKVLHLTEDRGGHAVTSMQEDDGLIWLGTEKGLYCFEYATEDVRRFELRADDGTYVTGEVTAVVMDKDRNLWISTIGQGVFRYNRHAGELKRYDFSECANDVATIYVDKGNQVWTLTKWGPPALSRLNKASDDFEPFPLQHNGRPVEALGLALYEDSEQRFWVGTWESGLYEVDRLTGHVKVHLGSSDRFHGTNHIHSVTECAPHKLVISSDDGVLLYDTHTSETEFYTEDEESQYCLSCRFAYPLLKDREGGIWIGTYYGGVNYLSPSSGQFDSYFKRKHSNSVGGRVISRFIEDGDGNIWIASDDGGLSCFNPRTERFRNYVSDGKPNSLSYDNVHALCLDGDDLWVGTYSGGINVLDLKTGIFRHYYPSLEDERSLDGSSSYAIFKDSDGILWIATMDGINQYDRDTDSFIRVKKLKEPALDIDQDNDGNIWFSTNGDGLLRYVPETQEWKTYRHDKKVPGSIPGDFVNCSFVDSHGVLWVGTTHGLCSYDPESDTFLPVLKETSMIEICGIIEDSQVFWITTTEGLVRYDPAVGTTAVFSTSDGLRSNQFIPNAILKASDGRIYVGTANGFNAFYPYEIKTNQTVPQLAITSLTVDNNIVHTGDRRLSKSLTAADRIEILHQDNGLTLQYAALSYFAPNKNQYAYKLDGFDKDWIRAGNLNRVTYTNLPTGRYTFMVKGTNNDALWNEEAVSIDIWVRPHVLFTWPFIILYIIVALAMILMITSYMSRRSKIRYESKVAELDIKKEKEIQEAKIKFFTTIAHEIRTPVSLIIGPLEKIMKKADMLPGQVAEDLHVIDRNSNRLLVLVNQLLDFRKVEQDGMEMHFVRQQIVPLLRSVCERFEPTIAHKGLRLEMDFPNAEMQVCFDSEAMTKIVSNLLTNASKYSKTVVRLTCEQNPTDASMFNISVFDDGIGISKADQEKIFRPFYQIHDTKPGTGIGLNLVKSLAELHGGFISVKSEEGEYTVFTLTLPIEQQNVAVASRKEDIKPESHQMLPDDILSSSIIEHPAENKPSIMIVDDNEEMVNFLSSTFSEQYQVIRAADGVDALEQLKLQNDVALVVADWMMPRMDGVELCRRIRTDVSLSHIPFILLTAKTDDASKVAGMDCGADAYIEKPFSIQYLEACIRNLVGLRAMLRQKFANEPLTTITTVAGNNTDNSFLYKMTELIEAHFSDSNLSVDFLSEQMGISRSSLYNKIKVLTDKTPNELIQLMRLKKAAQLLAEHKYRINEICYMVGFNNPSYFSKCFQKQFGMKPGEFLSRAAGE